MEATSAAHTSVVKKRDARRIGMEPRWGCRGTLETDEIVRTVKPDAAPGGAGERRRRGGAPRALAAANPPGSAAEGPPQPERPLHSPRHAEPDRAGRGD